jgi:surfeit locus 1 family protein
MLPSISKIKSIRPVKFRFSLAIVPAIIFIGLLVLLIRLGFWQLGRAEEKRQELTLFAQRNVENRLVITENFVDNPSTYRYRHVEITGHYDFRQQFLIDNQIVQGKPGYFVMTPFIIPQLEKAILVNRGWVPLIPDRSKLPDISLKTIAAKITGRLNKFPSVGIVLAGAEIPSESWPSVVQVVNVKILADKLGYDLFQSQMELDPEMPDGFLREWKTALMMTPERHTAYAVQWFGLALTLIILCYLFSRKNFKDG